MTIASGRTILDYKRMVEDRAYPWVRVTLRRWSWITLLAKIIVKSPSFGACSDETDASTPIVLDAKFTGALASDSMSSPFEGNLSPPVSHEGAFAILGAFKACADDEDFQTTFKPFNNLSVPFNPASFNQ